MKTERGQVPVSNRRRVLILNATYAIGGAERILQLLALQLGSRLDVHVCSLYQPGEIGEQMREAGIPFHAINGRSRTDWRVLPRFLSLLRRIRPEVLLTVDAPVAVLYAVLVKRLKIVRKLVIAVHSFGKTKRTREMAFARRFAAEGFFAMALDLYSREGAPLLPDLAAVQEWIRNLDDLRVLLYFVQQGIIRIEPVVSHVVPIEQAAAVYETLRDHPAELLGVIFDWTQS